MPLGKEGVKGGDREGVKGESIDTIDRGRGEGYGEGEGRGVGLIGLYYSQYGKNDLNLVLARKFRKKLTRCTIPMSNF